MDTCSVIDPSKMSYIDSGTSGDCEYITRNWTATDPCGNTGTCVQCLNIELDDSVIIAVSGLKPNHFRYIAGLDFDSEAPAGGGQGNNKSFTIADTQYCTCKNIVERCEYGKGHIKHGCSSSVMDTAAMKCYPESDCSGKCVGDEDNKICCEA